jgi:hypothetical protein
MDNGQTASSSPPWLDGHHLAASRSISHEAALLSNPISNILLQPLTDLDLWLFLLPLKILFS